MPLDMEKLTFLKVDPRFSLLSSLFPQLDFFISCPRLLINKESQTAQILARFCCLWGHQTHNHLLKPWIMKALEKIYLKWHYYNREGSTPGKADWPDGNLCSQDHLSSGLQLKPGANCQGQH